MDTAAAEDLEDVVEASFHYLVHTGPKPVTDSSRPGFLQPRHTGEYETRRALVRNARRVPDVAIERYGFVLRPQPTKMTDFHDEDEIRSVYDPEVEALVREATGASRVLVFDHTLRSGRPETREEKGIRGPVHRVHNDYTEWSGPQRLRDLLPDEAEALLLRRFAVVQVWRGMLAPVARSPLALCDARSVAPRDLIPTERRHPDRVGETYHLTYNPGHRWHYYPDMQPDEALVFKCYDSERDRPARFTPHSAFDHPGAPADAPPRESIETRTLAFFG